MNDAAAAYRTSQVIAASPAERVVLLYRAAIRAAVRHIDALGIGDREAAHTASLRAQEIVAALRETLDMSVGPIAARLDALYDFCLDRMITGNLRRDPEWTREAIFVLQGLLEAWTAIALQQPQAQAGPAIAPRPAPAAVPPAIPALPAGSVRRNLGDYAPPLP